MSKSGKNGSSDNNFKEGSNNQDTDEVGGENDEDNIFATNNNSNSISEDLPESKVQISMFECKNAQSLSERKYWCDKQFRSSGIIDDYNLKQCIDNFCP